MKKILTKVLVLLPLAALQVLWLLLLMKFLAPFSTLISLALTAAAFFLVLFIILNREESTYKILWLILILTFPIVGALLYLVFGNKRPAKPLEKKLQRVTDAQTPPALPTGKTPIPGDARMAQTLRWLEKETGYPISPVDTFRYYPVGDEMFPDMLKDIEGAEKYLYLEYFIIEPGIWWNRIADALEEKVRQGVDVRVMYDNLGSIYSFNIHDAQELEQRGISCATFNPMFLLKGSANYRDHRKMLIVDGKIAYSGGINLGDRYGNLEHPFGHWKDTAFRLTGAPVENYTHMFLTFWNAFSLHREIPDLPPVPVPETREDMGMVLSYYDSPLNREAVSNQLYIDLLGQSTDYAWFTTPYLMPGDDLLNAMVAAAHRGVDVRIIMPGIPDKKMIFRMSQSFYQVLLTEGVKIYEYTPGFVHAKSFVSDDRICTVGTVNLDYRSLFLHFENNSLFYNSPMVNAVKQDFLDTQKQCRQVAPYESRRYSRRWVVDGILRIFAPLC